jgi:divalent metal cation (Fe/Co/Zn/Cd) transporter
VHVKADPTISLEAAHEIAAKVKYAILEAIPSVVSVLVHMEPYRENLVISGDALMTLPPM